MTYLLIDHSIDVAKARSDAAYKSRRWRLPMYSSVIMQSAFDVAYGIGARDCY